MRTTPFLLTLAFAALAVFAIHNTVVAVAEATVVSAEVQPVPPPPVPEYAPGRWSMVTIELEGGRCSGVVVGKRTVMTANHCFGKGDKIIAISTLQPTPCDPRAIQLHCGTDMVPASGRIVANDGHDHVLVELDRELTGYRIAKVNQQVLPPGMDLYFWGSPGGMRTQLRRGYVCGLWTSDDGREFVTIEMNTWYGDSGGAFFNTEGEVVAILYGGYTAVRNGRQWGMTLVEPLAFQPHHLRGIK